MDIFKILIVILKQEISGSQIFLEIKDLVEANWNLLGKCLQMFQQDSYQALNVWTSSNCNENLSCTYSSRI